MLKRVDVAVFETIKAVAEGAFARRHSGLRPVRRRRRLRDVGRLPRATDDRRSSRSSRRRSSPARSRCRPRPDMTCRRHPDARVDRSALVTPPARRVTAVSARRRDGLAGCSRVAADRLDNRPMTDTTTDRAVAIELRNIVKRFPGVVANDEVNVDGARRHDPRDRRRERFRASRR